MSKDLSKKEVLFCQGYVSLGNITEAAKLAGYNLKTAYSLLLKPEIKTMCDELSQDKTYGKNSALEGLSRLAFGGIDDAISLLLNKESTENFEGLDLFCVSKIKISEKGDLEIVFHDRQRALSELLEYAQKEENKTDEGSFYDALESSAKSLNKAGSDDL